jgi:hypothetical protein
LMISFRNAYDFLYPVAPFRLTCQAWPTAGPRVAAGPVAYSDCCCAVQTFTCDFHPLPRSACGDKQVLCLLPTAAFPRMFNQPELSVVYCQPARLQRYRLHSANSPPAQTCLQPAETLRPWGASVYWRNVVCKGIAKPQLSVAVHPSFPRQTRTVGPALAHTVQKRCSALRRCTTCI